MNSEDACAGLIVEGLGGLQCWGYLKFELVKKSRGGLWWAIPLTPETRRYMRKQPRNRIDDKRGWCKVVIAFCVPSADQVDLWVARVRKEAGCQTKSA